MCPRQDLKVAGSGGCRAPKSPHDPKNLSPIGRRPIPERMRFRECALTRRCPQQRHTPLRESQPLGQTFKARHAGLRGIEVYITPGGPASGEIVLTVRSGPGSTDEIASARLDAREITNPGYYPLLFPSIGGSHNQSYFIQLEMKGPGEVNLGLSPADSYLDGAFYIGGEPGEAQLVFRTQYNPAWVVVGLARQALNWLWVLLLCLWLFLVPGLALVVAFYPRSGALSWLETLILGTGVGVASYPILFLLTDLAGVHPGKAFAWGPSVLGGSYLIYKAWGWLSGSVSPRRRWWRPADRIPEFAALLVIGLLLAGRFYPVAGLEAPMWGDSYQHSVITQLMFDNGGLFDSWQPYAELTAFTYHFGFHSIAAVFGWASGESSWRAVLWAGQILNLIAVVGLYPLAMRLSKSRWGGVLALVAAGALAPMPMAYINWGRYTQLAGQAILPIAIYFGWRALESRKVDWRLSALSWVVWGGLALTHYRVLIFGVIFILAYLAVRIWRPNRQAVLRRLLAVTVGAGVLFFPWFLHIFAGRIIDMLVSQLTTPPSSQTVWAVNNRFNFTELAVYLPLALWVLAAAGIVWALVRKRHGLALVAIWAGLVLFAANPDWVGLPGEGALSNFAVFIAAYIPAGLLIGGAAGEALGLGIGGQESSVTPFSIGAELYEKPGEIPALPRYAGETNRSRTGEAPAITRTPLRATWQLWLSAALIVFLSGWGVRERLRDVDSSLGSLVTRPDIHAAQWIKENIPEGARFHVNQFFAFSESVTVGSDAGWWLPLIADRATDLPPINYGFEQTSRADYREWTNALPKLIEEKGIDHPEVLAAFRERGITHIYIGQRQGRVNYSGPEILEPERLLDSLAFTPVYHEDRVWIFAINP